MPEPLLYADAHPKYFWCLGCDRVSMTEQIEGFYITCLYADCSLHRLEDERPFTVGAWWTFLRRQYHPEYPETPEAGTRYAMLGFRQRVARTEPENPYLG